MKLIRLVIFVFLAMALLASPALAGGTKVEVNNTFKNKTNVDVKNKNVNINNLEQNQQQKQEQKQQQWQKSTNINNNEATGGSVNNKIITPASGPSTSVDLSGNGSGGEGVSDCFTDISSDIIIEMYGGVLTASDVRGLEETYRKTGREKQYKKMMSSIVIYNDIPANRWKTATGAVQMIKELPPNCQPEYIGPISSDAKDIPDSAQALRQFQVVGGIAPEGMKVGATHIMPIKDFKRAVPTQAGWNASAYAAMAGGMSGGVASGGVGGGFGRKWGKTRCESSTTWVALRITCVVPAVPVYQDCSKLREDRDKLLRETDSCRTFCWTNFLLRRQIGDLNVELFLCTGDNFYLFQAIEQYGGAEQNYKRGGADIKKHYDAGTKMLETYELWYTVLIELGDKSVADSFAQEKRLDINRKIIGFAR